MRRKPESFPQPLCCLCESYYHFGEAAPMVRNGVKMHLGENYCIGGKRPRRFRARDTKQKPPAWCPKRKTPCELRIYGFIDEETRRRRVYFINLFDQADDPLSRNYGLRFEGTTDLTPRRFWDRCNDPCSELNLPAAVDYFDIIEIDDGMKPVCFYRTYEGYKILRYFDPSDMRTRSSHAGSAQKETAK